jgi:hypothetical protein
MTLFTTGPDGMTGNDDLGTMSAWYVFSSLGLYPTMSGANFLAVSSPQFPTATVRIGAYAGQGGTLTITAPGVSDTNRYVQQARLNGADLSRTWVDWSSVARGGTIAQTVGASPSAWGTATAAQPPSVNRPAGDLRTHLDASLRPATAVAPTGGTAQQTRFEVDVLGQSPRGMVATVRATLRQGWTAEVRPSTVRLMLPGLPASARATVTVTMPAGTPAGSYPIRVTVSGYGITTVTREATVDVRVPAACAAGVDGQCAVDLSGERDTDGTATVAQSTEGTFDGAGWSYDAALLPPAGPVTWGGVTYDAPDPNGTAATFVAARGQSVLLPAGRHGRLHLVAAAHNGPVSTRVTVGYADGSTATLPITVADWCGTAEPGSTAVLTMPHRIKAYQGVDGPPVSLFGFGLPLDATKEIRSVSLPADPRVRLYAATLS